MKNAFDELIGRPDTDEKRISELEDISQFLKLKSKEKKTEKKNKLEYPRSMVRLQKCNICIIGIPKGREKETEEYLKQ